MEPLEETFTPEENEAWQAFTEALPQFTLDNMQTHRRPLDSTRMIHHAFEGSASRFVLPDNPRYVYKMDYALESDQTVITTIDSSTGAVTTQWGVAGDDDDEDGVIIVTGVAQ